VEAAAFLGRSDCILEGGILVDCLIEISQLSKTFDSGRALDNADLSLRPAEIHGLVGQNGCGKSTLIKILSGFHEPDPGATCRFDGADLRLGDSGIAEQAGIHFVHQDLGLISELSVVENLALGAGYSTGRLGRIRWKNQVEVTARAMRNLGYDVDPKAEVGLLSPSECVGVAIARALVTSKAKPLRLLVLDEPTAALPHLEVKRLFSVLRRLKGAGVASLLVSHRLDELFAVTERISVFRNGRRVATSATAELSQDELVEQILGRPLIPHSANGLGSRAATPLVEVRGLTGVRLRSIDFEVYPGEVLGLVGVTGSGREEVAALVSGATKGGDGSVKLGGTHYSRLTPHRAKKSGIAFLPTDRRRSAILPDATVRENLTLPALDGLSRAGRLSGRREKAESVSWLHRMQVQPPQSEILMVNLSGGNQQKVLLARWMRTKPKLLVLDEPTQGVDIGTKSQIYRLLSEAAKSGIAVVVCTTDGQEAVELCDRVLVLADGVCRRELSGASLTPAIVDQELLGGQMNMDEGGGSA
jgi:ribose transport system ATP-binding protein